MDYYLNTRRVLAKAPDMREERRRQILQELRTPERLTDGVLDSLITELGELQADLQKNPPEIEEE